MPNRDRTGPEGKGAKTGRQMGDCKGTQPQKGLGRGLGRGRGLGFKRNLGRNFQDQEEKE